MNKIQRFGEFDLPAWNCHGARKPVGGHKTEPRLPLGPVSRELTILMCMCLVIGVYCMREGVPVEG